MSLQLKKRWGWALIAMNLAIIVLAYAVPDQLFFELGIIHALSGFFVVTDLILIAQLRFYGGHEFKRFFLSSTAALLFIGLAHFIEYLLLEIVTHGGSVGRGIAVDTTVIAMYQFGFLLSLWAYSDLVRFFDSNTSPVKRWVTGGTVLAIGAMVLYALYVITLQHENPLGGVLFIPVVVTAVTLLIGLGATEIIRMLRGKISALDEGLRYYRLGIFAIMASSALEFSERTFHDYEVNLTYFSHFATYVGLSLIMYGLISLFAAKGVYKDMQEAMAKQSSV